MVIIINFCIIIADSPASRESGSLRVEKCRFAALFNLLGSVCTYKLIEIALTGQAVIHCSQTTQRDRKKFS